MKMTEIKIQLKIDTCFVNVIVFCSVSGLTAMMVSTLTVTTEVVNAPPELSTTKPGLNPNESAI